MKNIFKFIVLPAFLVAVSILTLSSQSRYFDERYLYTQAHINPQLINPGAMGAAMEHQVLVNYRNKWASFPGSPKTVTLSYNGPVGNRLGFGANFISDTYGELQMTKGLAGLTYTIKSETNQIGFGLTAEYIKHSLSGSVLTNEQLAKDDPVINAAVVGAEYFDASVGIYGIYMNKLSYGLVLPSLISSRISDTDLELPERDLGVIVHFGYRLEASQSDVSITPSMFIKKLANVPTHVDLNLLMGFLNDQFTGGVSYTLGADKRLGFLVGTKIDKLNFYYSYNTSSSLIQDYNNGSHEITFGINFGGIK
ncbi:MAG: PorP/SprF family type IX secretion system membrane protein [Saprospiraceae bacterium]|nr:PorP/SprF family type IX secretion system membrane protein [Saprospiraceae bacterium]